MRKRLRPTWEGEIAQKVGQITVCQAAVDYLTALLEEAYAEQEEGKGSDDYRRGAIRQLGFLRRIALHAMKQEKEALKGIQERTD